MRDLALSATGDLIPDWQGGLEEVDGILCDLQDIHYRLLTNDPDHRLWRIGANLEDLTGQPNTAATGSQGEASIIAALTRDGRFNAVDVTVSSVPISYTQIQFNVGFADRTVRTTAEVVSIVINLDS